MKYEKLQKIEKERRKRKIKLSGKIYVGPTPLEDIFSDVSFQVRNWMGTRSVSGTYDDEPLPTTFKIRH
jgi:hypothetical protein